MNHKKNIFSKNLYLEGLRQLKILGFLGLIINLIIGTGIPVGTYLSEKEVYNSYTRQHMVEMFSKAVINVEEYHLYYFLFFLVFAPLMVLSLFKFLNQRESCDFYHSLPHRRLCIFFSFATAIFTWLLVEILVTTAVSAALYHLFSKYLILNSLHLLCFALNVLITSLLVASVMLLACTLSGNLITSMVVFLIIFFIPRVFISIYQLMMTNALPYLTDEIIHLFNVKNHLFYVFFIYIFSNSETFGNVTSLTLSSLYTLVMALLAFALASAAFVKRDSESAGNSMNHKFLQTFFRTVFTMLICMIPISIIFDFYTYRFTNSFMDSNAMILFYIIISYIGALVGMFLYELLTTKNAKSALRSLKSIPVIALLNLVIIVSLFATFHHYRNLRLEKEEIDSVSILSTDFYNGDSYFDAKIAKCNFTNEELISLLCTAFNDYADRYDEFLKGNINSVHDSDFYPYEDSTLLTIQFHGKSNQTFSFYADGNTSAKFYNIYYEDKSISDIFRELPDLTEDDIIYLQNYSGYSSLEEYDARKLYESLKDELLDSDISIKSWMNSLDNYGSTEYIYVYKYMDSGYYELNLPITNATPQTYALLLTTYKSIHKNDLENFLTFTSDFSKISLDSSGSKYMSLDITGYDANQDSPLSLCLYSPSEDDPASRRAYQEAAFALLRDNVKTFTGDMSGDDILIYVNVTLDDYAKNDYKNKLYILCIPRDVFMQLFEENF